MLVLSRGMGKRVVINPGEMGQITVTVIGRSRDGGVRLGFEAPRKTVIHREEMWAGIRASRKAGRAS